MDMIKELNRQGQALIVSVDKQLDLLEKKRGEHAKVSLAAEKAKDHMMRTHRIKTLEYSTHPDVAGQVDPKTGKPNKEWSGYLLDGLIEEDEEYINAHGALYKFQEELTEIQTVILGVSERVNVLKAEMRLVAAMLDTARPIAVTLDGPVQ